MDPACCVVLVPARGFIEPDCEAGLRELEKRGYTVRRSFSFAAIDLGRSVMASHELDAGFTELMWIDSDISFHPNDVDRLRKHNLAMCCGLYPKKSGQSLACVFPPDTKGITFGPSGGLTEVLYTGFGFVHTRRELYERIREQLLIKSCNERFGRPITPWFLPEIIPDGDGSWYLSEDYSFCYRARKCGVPIMADTTLCIAHIHKHHLTYESLSRK